MLSENQMANFHTAIDLAFARLWDTFSESHRHHPVLIDEEQREALYDLLDTYTQEFKFSLDTQPNLHNPQVDMREISSPLFNYVRGWISEFVNQTAQTTSKQQMRQSVPQDLIDGISQIAVDRPDLANTLQPLVTAIQERARQPMETQIGKASKRELRSFSVYSSPDLDLKAEFPELWARFHSIWHRFWDMWAEQATVPESRKLRADMTETILARDRQSFYHILTRSLERAFLPFVYDELSVYQHQHNLEMIYSEEEILAFIDRFKTEIADWDNSVPKRLRTSKERSYLEKWNLQFSLDQVIPQEARLRMDSELANFVNGPPKTRQASDSSLISNWIDQYNNWYHLYMGEAFEWQTSKVYDRAYMREYIEKYHHAIQRALRKMLDDKPDSWEEEPAYTAAKSQSSQFTGNYNENILMPLHDTRYQLETIRKFMTKAAIAAQSTESIEHAITDLRTNLQSIPELAFLRYPRARKRNLLFEPNIIREDTIHQLLKSTRIPLHTHEGQNVFHVQLGKQLADFPDVLSYHCVRKGLINLFEQSIHHTFELYGRQRYGNRTFINQLKQALPDSYPVSGDCAGVLGFFCEYTNDMHADLLQQGYDELFKRFGYPAPGQFCQPIEQQLPELTPVPFTGCHMDITPNNTFSERDEEGWEELDRRGEADVIRLIDAEKFIPGPLMLNFACMTGRFGGSAQTNEQLLNQLLDSENIPTEYTGTREQAKKDYEIYLGFEMVKSALSDGVRSQQMLMKNGDTPEVRAKIAGGLDKINQGIKWWQQAGMTSAQGLPIEQMDEDTFVQHITEFNNEKKYELLSMVREAQERYQNHGLTDSKMDQLIRQINDYRLFWDQDADFPEEYISLIAILNQPDLTDDEIIAKTMQSDFSARTRKQSAKQPKSPQDRLIRAAKLDGPTKSKPTQDLVISNKEFGELMAKSRAKFEQNQKRTSNRRPRNRKNSARRTAPELEERA